MIKESRERELPNKEEGGTNNLTEHRTSAGLWPSVQNPRIVRVSRAFGGKDRHSKVSTVRGLRDRRVRLSVPTALQLYDLQDKLGLTQPSKVIDWLINESQHEIDKLPPLQFPQTWASSSAMNDSVLSSNNSFYDMAPFPKAACLNSEALSCNPYNQFEPEAQEFPLTSALMPSLFSSYLTSPSNFETAGTFAQLLPWSSSMYANTSLKQGIHQDEAQQVAGMREKTDEVYKDCGGRHGSNAGDFL